MMSFPALLFSRPRPLLAANDVAFAVLFGIFIVALLTLIVIVADVGHPARPAGAGGLAAAPAGPERRPQKGDVPAARQPMTPSRLARPPPRPNADAAPACGVPGPTPSTRRRPEPRTAFVLAGGGSRGAVQVGMLDELTERGIRADRVFGASVGAINGAAYAGNPTRRASSAWPVYGGT